MVSRNVTIQNSVGLHARPATFFVQKANSFKASIWVEKEDCRVNAKSLLGILSLGITRGTSITLIADGEDETAAVAGLNKLSHVVLTLAESLALKVEPCAALVNDLKLDSHVDNLAGLRDTRAVEDIELGGLEGGSNLVLNNLTSGVRAVNLGAVLKRLNAANVDTHGGVELKSLTTGGNLGVAVHNANLLTKLVGEDNDTVGLCDSTGELSHRLRHKSCLQTNVRVAHIPLYLRSRNECRNRVNYDDIDSAGVCEGLSDGERLLTVIGLRYEKVVDVNAKLLCIRGDT